MATSVVLPPKLTQDGCMLQRLNPRLFHALKVFLASKPAKPEPLNPYLGTVENDIVPVLMTELDSVLRNMLHAALKPLATDWVKRQIVPSAVYGIRTYQRGAILRNHRDREGTHIVSAIINVAQKVDKPWPLFLECEEDTTKYRRVFLQPGDLFFYEGARLDHGRTDPLEGDSYSNVFVHYKLA